MKFLFIAFLILSGPLFAQKQVVQLDNITYSNFIKDRTAFSLSNADTGDLAVVIPDKRTVTAYLFDENFRKTDEITAESLRIKFKEIIGYRVTNTHYTTLFSTENKQYFGIVDFDFETGKTITKQLEINLSDEDFLEAVSHNNRFFLLSIGKDFDGLIVRELLENGTLERREISFDGPAKFKDLLILRNKYDALGERKGSAFNQVFPPHVVEVDNTNPNSLETTSRLNKLYAKDENLILTFDNFQDFTLAYFLDLNSFKVTEKRFTKEKVDNESFEKSNSFLYKDIFFQIGVDDDKMIFTISNFTTGEVLKTYRATKERGINFKNSDILQKNGAFMSKDGVRELNETSQFLRKITNGQPGIAIQKIGGQYQITIGGTEVSGGSSGVGNVITVVAVVVGGAAGGMAAASFSSPYFNPTFVSYGSYSGTKSVYIDALFDEDFNHIEGYPVENVFDKIKIFQDSLKGIDAEEVFSHNGKVYFGYYHKKSEAYNIYAFDSEI